MDQQGRGPGNCCKPQSNAKLNHRALPTAGILQASLHRVYSSDRLSKSGFWFSDHKHNHCSGLTQIWTRNKHWNFTWGFVAKQKIILLSLCQKIQELSFWGIFFKVMLPVLILKLLLNKILNIRLSWQLYVLFPNSQNRKDQKTLSVIYIIWGHLG